MNVDLRQVSFFVVGCVLAFVPVFGSNWLVALQANREADLYLAEQTAIARSNADRIFNEAFEELRMVAEAGSATCSSDHLRAMHTATIGNASMSLTAALSSDGQIMCIVPDLTGTALQIFGESVSMRQEDISISQVRLEGTRITGLLIELRQDTFVQAAIIPRSVLSNLFNQVANSTGIVLSLGETVIYGRELTPFDENQRVDADFQSQALSVGPMRVQVSIDRNTIESNFDAIQRWVTIGAITIGILVVLLVTRLIHYTPKQINEIERAIDHDEFVPHYQPTIDIATGKLVGCEVLVRWIKADGTMVSPGAFIGIAEQTGLAVPMTRNLMRSVVKDLEKAYAGRRGLKVAINLFNHHFTNLDIIQDVEEIFGPSSIAYSQLVFEITERAPLESVSQAKVIMRKLQRMGCRLALDDAGTGHGGLAYLQELGLNIVKIDKMFIDQLGKNRIGESITTTLTELANQLNMDVVAEGVESVQQVEHLRKLGIRHAQGYLFAPALPADRYLALVEKLGVAPSSERKTDLVQETALKEATIREAARQIKAGEAA